MSTTYVAYYRVSTKHQGESGLGLDAQRQIVASFLAREANGDLVHEYVEVEAGKKSARPRLQEAIQLCKKTGAVLVVAKLDRLARSVQFTSTLLNSEVQFVACDLPSANRFTIHILAALAEEEARLISERTKAALAVAKQRGVILGRKQGSPPTNSVLNPLNPHSTFEPQKVQTHQDKKMWKAAEIYKDVVPIITTLRKRGETYAAIAETLNESGFTTPKGCKFSGGKIYDICQRLAG